MEKGKHLSNKTKQSLSFDSLLKSVDESIHQSEQLEREQEQELQKKLKERNDGSIKGLILSGDYVRKISDRQIIGGVYIFTQNYNENNVEWDVLEEDTISTKPANLITISEKEQYSDLCEKLEKEIENIVTLCRRKLKKKDILFVIHDLNSSEGLVFTDKSLFVLNDDKLDYIIDYEEMEEIDFDEEELTITVTDGESVTIDCWDDKRAKGVFNLLMDIKEFEE